MNFFKKVFQQGKVFILIISGSMLTAIALNVFLVPYKVAPGGVAGIATVLYYLVDGQISVGTLMLLLNIPLFLGGMKVIGKKFTFRTLLATVFLSFIMNVTEPFTQSFIRDYLSDMGNSQDTPDLLLYALFGGFLMGVGLGLVFKVEATTGGTDLAARIIHLYIPNITIGQLLLLIDAGVVIFAAIVFESFQVALYSIVSLYISAQVIDAILEGVNFAKALYIISNRSEEIAQAILYDLDRGVTVLKGTGMYTGEDKNVLFCVIHRSQLIFLKQKVQKIDPKAFVILTDIREVLGEGFKTYTAS